MNIVQLNVENVKRLSAVSITPEGNVIVVGGMNGAGKSSVLDAIAYALGGKALLPEEPIRRGQTEGKVVVDLGDFTVTRTFRIMASADDAVTNKLDSKLVVTNKDGAAYPSPQAMLDKLLGKLTFDPLEFAGLKPAQQREVLKGLVNLDTSLIDERYKEEFGFRTHWNREEARLSALSNGLPFYEDVPEAELSMATVIDEITAAEAARGETKKAEAGLQAWERGLEADKRAVAEWAREVERLQEELEAAQGHLTKSAARVTEATEKVTRQAEEVERLRAAEPNVDAIRAKMTEVESINAKVRANAEKAKVMAALNEAGVKAKQHDTTVNDLAAAKKLMLERVEYPVPGLGINDSGVTFNDLPLEQASTAEQLRVSVAIGLALNPKLKVLLVRNGNALDSKSLALVSEMAEKAGAQIWMERVAESAEGVTVMIEDGHLA